MSGIKRFFIGGTGAMMPVLVSLLAIDLGAALNHPDFTAANVIGTAIRDCILFLIGGYVAYLHNTESHPFKVFELGIAAPALLTSIIASQAIPSGPGEGRNAFNVDLSLIPSAYAETRSEKPKNMMLASSILSQIIDGATGRAYRKLEVKQAPPADKNEADVPKPKPAPEPVKKQAAAAKVVGDKAQLKFETTKVLIKAPTAPAFTISENVESMSAATARAKAAAIKKQIDALQVQYQKYMSRANAN